MNLVTVREHARLTTGPLAETSLDRAGVPASAFDWLCREASRFRAGGAALAQLESRQWLRLDHYVGVIETPCGTRIEILPKHVDADMAVAAARAVFRRMLRHGLQLPVRDVGPASLHTVDAPVDEWIMQQFLQALDALVHRGLRNDYHPVAASLRFLRGRLQLARQLRQPPGRQPRFAVEHQVFDADRAENRLLATALDKVAGRVRHADHWRLAMELRHRLAAIPRSQQVRADFRSWRGDRLMSDYAALRPWCELILGEMNPLAGLGAWRGRSLLFPMEKLFERYVGACLRAQLPAAAKLTAQASGHWLCHADALGRFRLRPDFVIEHRGERLLLDAKWKLLDAADAAHNYGLSQADFYQLFAYGQRYLGGRGRMALVYPQTPRFQQPLPRFHFDAQLSLDVLPLDLESGCLPGSWLPCSEQVGAAA